jgi:hypothetical protein
MTDNNKKMNSEPIFGNLAYDLNTLTWDPFDGSAVRQPQEQPQERPQEPLRRPERYERPRRESRRRPAARPQPYVSPIVAGVAVLMLMTVVLVLGYLRLTKASHEVTARQAQLQQVQEDNAALGVAYEKAFDQSSVKAAAQSAGMTKPTTDQIEYIELGGANMAEICRPESTGPLAQAWNWVRNGVDAVVEYFR